MKTLNIDIETYSECDLGEAGVYKYANHPSTEILMIAYSIDGGEVKCVDLTRQNIEDTEVYDYLTDNSYTIIAHNANFERVVLRAKGVNVPINRWRCTMVQALYCGLPAQLGTLSEILELGEFAKDKLGEELIKYFSMPCKPTKANGKRTRNKREHLPEAWQDFINYCIQDVYAEMAAAEKLRDYPLPLDEVELWHIDQEMNDKGVQIDTEFINRCLEMKVIAQKKVRSELSQLTGLANPNSPKQFGEWLREKTGDEPTSVDKKTLNLISKANQDADLKRAILLKGRLSKSSLSKYETMLKAQTEDGRVRGVLQFYGAERTGRWAGRLFQIHNLPKYDVEPEELEVLRNSVLNLDIEAIELIKGDAMNVLSGLIRTAIVASEGKRLIVSDFSAIEARVLAWIANETWRLEVFATHGKIYEASAANIFGKPLEDVTSADRSLGKVAELALGYQGSVGAINLMLGDPEKLDETTKDKLVRDWRRANPSIVAMWYAFDKASVQAVAYFTKTGETATVTLAKYRNISFICDAKCLRIRLPSGRYLTYWKPELQQGQFGLRLTYLGRASDAKARRQQVYRGVTRLGTYGGKLAENVCQAVARDLLAHAIKKVRYNGIDVRFSVHDEIIAEEREDESVEKLKRLEELMSELPEWAEGLILRSEGFISKYYRK